LAARHAPGGVMLVSLLAISDTPARTVSAATVVTDEPVIEVEKPVLTWPPVTSTGLTGSYDPPI
jgi:hypothetical protein